MEHPVLSFTFVCTFLFSTTVTTATTQATFTATNGCIDNVRGCDPYGHSTTSETQATMTSTQVESTVTNATMASTQAKSAMEKATMASTQVESTVTKATMASTQAASAVTFGCTDRIQDCDSYGHSYICVGDYIPWAKINCPAYCGFCTASTILATKATIPKTQVTTSVAKATMTSTQVESTVTKATMASTQAASAVTNGCTDSIQDCDSYGYSYICVGEYIPWAKINCPAYCGFCTASTIENHSASYTTTAATQATIPKPQATTSVTQAITASTQAASAVPNGCIDKVRVCEVYGHSYICVGNFKPWAKLNCPAYCGFCTDSNTTNFSSVQTTTFATQNTISSTQAQITEKQVADVSTQAVASAATQVDTTETQVTTIKQTTDIATQTTHAATQTASAATQRCFDKIPYCPIYGYDFACTRDNLAWAKVNCPMFCGLCTSTNNSTKPGCHDNVNNCDDYQSICVGNLKPWAKLNCRKYCGFCTDISQSTNRTTVSSRTPEMTSLLPTHPQLTTIRHVEQTTGHYTDMATTAIYTPIPISTIGTLMMDGGWTMWTPWSVCTLGMKSRMRTCTNPVPSLFGRDCDGRETDMVKCDLSCACNTTTHSKDL